jgi:hypothetical protein
MIRTVIISWNIIKLALISLCSLVIIVTPICFLNHYFSHFPSFVSFSLELLPILFLFGGLIFNRGAGNIGTKITSIRYSKVCPFLFEYDPGPDHYRFNDISVLRQNLQPCDVLLRRQERYIEGLILEQTSYFTHAAIYCGPGDGCDEQVMQAVGSGVEITSLDEFVRCDEIAVLRFNLNLIRDDTWINKPHKIFEDCIEMVSINLAKKIKPDDASDKASDFIQQLKLDRIQNIPISDEHAEKIIDLERSTYVDQIKNTAFDENAERIKVIRLIDADIDCKQNSPLNSVGHEEEILFKYLMKCFAKKQPNIDLATIQTFIPNVLKLCNLYIGRCYDFGFNFNDSDKLSCVEYVWECYKALFPLHQVRRKIIYYFKWVKTLVIVPDMFLLSEFFTLQYSSVRIPEVTTENLYSAIEDTKLNFYGYIFKITAWQIGIWFALYALSGFRRWI